ncbi:MAG: YeiH family protein, partial [Helicobacter sp.]|nr:YeiH family protein [Helicobacter sp.]
MKGFLLTSAITFFAFFLAKIPSIQTSTHLSPTVFAILIGICLSAWFFKHQSALEKGVNFSAKKLLRLGIILYGFNITFSELMEIGLPGFLASLIIIGIIFLAALLIGIKLLHLDRDTCMLIGAGSGICGAAAILALESTLKNCPSKTIIAVSCIVIFGLLCMFLYPLAFYTGLIPLLDQNSMGFFMGATLHEVANVVGASEIAKDMGGFPQQAANTAIIMKMIRVIMLVPFLLCLTYYLYKKEQPITDTNTASIQIPYFAFLFLAIILLHTFLSPYEETFFIGESSLHTFIDYAKFLSSLCIVSAMAALGLQINFKKLIKTSKKAFLLAFFLSILLIIGGYLLTLSYLTLD